MSGKEAENSVDVVEKVKEYLFEAEDFETTFMGWGKANCECIELDNEELKLECVFMLPYHHPLLPTIFVFCMVFG